MSIGKWIGNWVGKWLGKQSNNTLQGHGAVTTANWTATLDVITTSAVQPAPTSTEPGTGITSRNSDPHAYDSDRVAKRISKVIIAGREYDPFDAELPDRLDELANLPPPDIDDEIQRQDEKLSRVFEVGTASGTISVPVFKPMLDVIPSLVTATSDDFERYKAAVGAAICEERRRIVLLLSEF